MYKHQLNDLLDSRNGLTAQFGPSINRDNITAVYRQIHEGEFGRAKRIEMTSNEIIFLGLYTLAIDKGKSEFKAGPESNIRPVQFANYCLRRAINHTDLIPEIEIENVHRFFVELDNNDTRLANNVNGFVEDTFDMFCIEEN